MEEKKTSVPKEKGKKQSKEKEQEEDKKEEDGLPATVDEDLFHKAAKVLAEANRIVVFSGAGISAESGIATFRAPDIGIWANKLGLAYFGTPMGWWLSPGWAWRAYLSYFRDPIARAKPNSGHYAIAKLQHIQQETKDADFCIVTQNVDGLHQRAGNTDDIVYEVHGTVYRHRCSKNHHLHPYVLDPSKLDEQAYDPERDDFFSHESKNFPRCSEKGCNSYLRPDAVLFTESIPDEDWQNSYEAVRKLRSGDCMIVVGTSGVVYPAASLPEMAATKKGVTVIEVNPEPSALTDSVHMFLQGPSGRVLPVLVEEMKKLVKKKQGKEGKEKKKNTKKEKKEKTKKKENEGEKEQEQEEGEKEKNEETEDKEN